MRQGAQPAAGRTHQLYGVTKGHGSPINPYETGGYGSETPVMMTYGDQTLRGRRSHDPDRPEFSDGELVPRVPPPISFGEEEGWTETTTL